MLPDPVLLHDAAFWRALASSEDCAAADNALPGKYILYYAPGRGSREAEMTADALSAGMLGHGASSVRQGSARIPVLVVSDGASAGQGYGSPSAGVSMRRHVPCGPAGFISLVDSAECTVGTSYHLMLFSMILGKDFWCPDASSDSRKLQLLASAGLPADSRLFRFSDPAVRARTVSAAAATGKAGEASGPDPMKYNGCLLVKVFRPRRSTACRKCLCHGRCPVRMSSRSLSSLRFQAVRA